MSKFLVKQLTVGGYDNNFSYVAVNTASKNGFIVDPCGDEKIIKDMLLDFINNYKIKFNDILLTHGHHDHTEKVIEIANFLTEVSDNNNIINIIAHENSNFKIPNNFSNMILKKVDDEEVINSIGVKVLYTPGHTNDAVCYLLDDESAVFSGDTLFVDDIGFCEAVDMYESLRNKLWNLPDKCLIYSGHDYGRVKFCSIGESKKYNNFFKASKQSLNEFKKQLKKLI